MLRQWLRTISCRSPGQLHAQETHRQVWFDGDRYEISIEDRVRHTLKGLSWVLMEIVAKISDAEDFSLRRDGAALSFSAMPARAKKEF